MKVGHRVHIVKLLARRAAVTQPLSEVREQIRHRLEVEGRAKVKQDLIRELRQRSGVELFAGPR
jgi:parvulin-like peptidyl-prolyl isomerase